MGKTLSPLRYPGGKSKLSKRVQRLIEMNAWQDRIYVEPFAGGFGVGLYLLSNNIVENAILNDYDLHLYHFWHSVFFQTEELITLIHKTPVSLQERLEQKRLYSDPQSTELQDGFATLYLNRVNYSGVLFAGPIGGQAQQSKYNIGCRFNKENIIKRILDASTFRNRIQLFNLDATQLIDEALVDENANYFYYIDPPYVLKGKSLYGEYYSEQDHRDFCDCVRQHLNGIPWIISYDNCALVREIYAGYRIHEYYLFHSAHDRVRGKELLITNLDEDQFEW